jgi:hypothetical protein
MKAAAFFYFKGHQCTSNRGLEVPGRFFRIEIIETDGKLSGKLISTRNPELHSGN